MEESSNNIENEIANLEAVLKEKKEILEQQKLNGEIEEIPHPKEILREAIREKIAATPGVSARPQPAPAPAQKALPPYAYPPSYLTDELKPKVDELVKIAFQKSLDEAIKMAKATDNPALIDAFHDIIVDEIYSQLVKSGKLEAVN